MYGCHGLTPATLTTAAAVTATATATAWWAGLARTSFIDCKRPTFHGLAIKFGDRFLRIRFTTHGDEGETARLAGEFVLHEGDFVNCANLSEEILEVRFGGIEGKISYV